MDSTLVPDWAPNVHPMLVHFPIAWLIAAIVVDLISLVQPRAKWAASSATFLYLAGAASAVVTYQTGRQAAATVLIPGMAHAIVQQHWNWALATTIFFTSLSGVRLVVFFLNRQPSYAGRAAFAGAALGGLLLLFYTGELGARLVYQYGVGVSSTSLPPAAPETTESEAHALISLGVPTRIQCQWAHRALVGRSFARATFKSPG
jgi:uncharacterized membrane protein